jgi:hypothetical protein
MFRSLDEVRVQGIVKDRVLQLETGGFRQPVNESEELEWSLTMGDQR